MAITQYKGTIQRPGQRPETVEIAAHTVPQLTSAEKAAGIQWVDGRYEPGDVRRYGAVGDGVADDTTAIQDALDSANSVYVTGGTYLISSALTPSSDTRIYGEGTIKLAGSTAAKMLYALSKSRIRLEGLTFDGNQANQVTPISSTPSGLHFSGCSDVQIVGCKIVEVSRYTLRFTNCSDVLVSGNEVDGGNGASGVSSATFLFETGSGETTTNIKVVNNTFTRNETSPLWTVGTFRGFANNDGLCNKVIFSGNRVTLDDDVGLVTATGVEFGNGCADFICDSNLFYGGSIGISVSGANNGTVSNNRVKMGSAASLAIAAGGHQGIEITSSGDISVTGNVIDGQTKLAKGISLTGSTYTGVSVVGNTIKDINPTTNYSSIFSSGQDNVTISGNTVQGAGYYGVFSQTSDHVSITGNSIEGTPRYGIYVKDSDDVTITGNSVVSSLAASNGIVTLVSDGVTMDQTLIEFNVTNTVAQGVLTSVAGSGAYTNFRLSTYGTTTLSSGTNQVGAIVWDTAPTAGGTIGWVCTTAGAPGTWKTFGSIAA